MKPPLEEVVAALRQDLFDAESKIEELGEEIDELRAQLRVYVPLQLSLSAEGPMAT